MFLLTVLTCPKTEETKQHLENNKVCLQYLQGNLNERVPATVFVGTGVYKEQLPNGYSS